MSKHNNKATPTMQESEDFFNFLCGEDVEFPYFKNIQKVNLPNPSYLEARFNN